MIDGVLNVYKEPGYTSHDVVAKLRGILHQKKIGHMGTLDPNAVGVLPICLGKATKLCSLLSQKDKSYDCTLLLGLETDTQDISGEVLNRAEEDVVANLDPKKIVDTLKSFIGEYDQIPPMYSAIKIGGEKLYEKARRGEVVNREARKCKIIDIVITGIEPPRVRFTVTCSKGTYVRTLCHDVGNKLGVYGCMEKLCRTNVERFDIKDSVTIDEIQNLYKNNLLDDYLYPVDDMLDNYSKCIVSSQAEKLVRNGNIFTGGNTLLKMQHIDDQIVRVYTNENEFIGLYKYIAEKGIYKPHKMFL